MGIGVKVGTGVGVGGGPGVRVNKTGAVLVACVPEISLYITRPGQVPTGMPFTVSIQLPLEERVAVCSGVTRSVPLYQHETSRYQLLQEFRLVA